MHFITLLEGISWTWLSFFFFFRTFVNYSIQQILNWFISLNFTRQKDLWLTNRVFVLWFILCFIFLIWHMNGFPIQLPSALCTVCLQKNHKQKQGNLNKSVRWCLIEINWGNSPFHPSFLLKVRASVNLHVIKPGTPLSLPPTSSPYSNNLIVCDPTPSPWQSYYPHETEIFFSLAVLILPTLRLCFQISSLQTESRPRQMMRWGASVLFLSHLGRLWHPPVCLRIVLHSLSNCLKKGHNWS